MKLKFKSTKNYTKKSIHVTSIVVDSNISSGRKQAIRDLVKLLKHETIIEVEE